MEERLKEFLEGFMGCYVKDERFVTLDDVCHKFDALLLLSEGLISVTHPMEVLLNPGMAKGLHLLLREAVSDLKACLNPESETERWDMEEVRGHLREALNSIDIICKESKSGKLGLNKESMEYFLEKTGQDLKKVGNYLDSTAN